MPVTTENSFDPRLTKRQAYAWDALHDPAIVEAMYGGAKGGGKSHFLCVWVLSRALEIAGKYKIPRSPNPPHIGWMGRKQATDFTQTTLQTWRRIIPYRWYRLRSATTRDPTHILIDGRVAVDYGGLDKQEAINKFNSAEYAFTALDQAEETTLDDVGTMRTSCRMTINDRRVEYKRLYTCNPRICWLKPAFISECPPHRCFIQALPSDNPYLPSDYRQTIYDAFGHRPELIKAYWEGDWNALEAGNVMIKLAWLEAAARRESFSPVVKEFLACDTARFGDDETVIGHFVNTELEDKWTMPYCRTTEISTRLAAESHKFGDIPIVLESTGADIGAGVADELYAMGRHVILYNPSKKVDPPKKYNPHLRFYNQRAQAWWEAARILSSGIVDKQTNLAMSCKNIDETIKEQITQPTYDWRNGQLIIESKKDIKARLGRSPDHADMFVIGLWAWDKVPPKLLAGEKTTYRDRYSRDKVNSPMLC